MMRVNDRSLAWRLLDAVLGRTSRSRPLAPVVAVLWLGLLACGPASALRIYPVTETQVVTATFDRQSPQPQLDVYKEKVGGRNTDSKEFEYLFWWCAVQNESGDPSAGACTNGSWNRTVKLRFTEKRSRLSVDLTLQQYKQVLYAESGNRNCPNPTRYGMTGVISLDLGCQTSAGTLPSTGWELNMWFAPGELNKLPSGGIWSARLPLDVRTRTSLYGKWTTNFEFRVTDKRNISAYLPDFGDATPKVDLNLRTQALTTAGGRVSGVANLDLCLYDGYNANSSTYRMKVWDSLSVAGRGTQQFSVRSIDPAAGGASDPYNRVDYTVAMQYNGNPMGLLTNGAEFTLPAVDTSRIRAVRLPNIPFPVVCTPAPLTLTTAPFNQLDKRAGRYQGTLSILFTPSSESL